MTGRAVFPITRLRLAERSTTAAAMEPMGSKQKLWLRIDEREQLWLFKYSRSSNGQIVGEHWSEKLGSEFARLIHLPAATVELATLDGAWGSLSEAFTNGDRPLIHGNDVLAGHDQSYNRDSSRGEPEHRIDRILQALAWATPEGEQRRAALHHFAGMLVLDAMILNTDRHHENWAVLMASPEEEQVMTRLAPSFDHASSLARNEPDDRCAAWLADRSLDRVAWYAHRAKGAIWLDSTANKAPSPLDLVLAMHRQDPGLFLPWLTILRAITPEQIAELVQRVPADTMPIGTRAFVTALVQYTTRTLAALP